MASQWKAESFVRDSQFASEALNPKPLNPKPKYQSAWALSFIWHTGSLYPAVQEGLCNGCLEFEACDGQQQHLNEGVYVKL